MSSNGPISPRVREITVRRLGELVDAAMPSHPDPASGRLREPVVFRGAASARWPLLSSLDRLGGVCPPHTKADLEEHILRNFSRRCRPYLQHPNPSVWELLVIAQHHGIPTRLLDWTYSPLVAAHFATLEPNPGADRVVWKLHWGRLHERFGLQPLAFLVEDLDGVLRDKGFATPWDLFESNHVGPERTFACLFDPPAYDDRLVVQAAAFTFCSDKNRTLDEVLRAYDLSDVLTRYIIPADCVDYLRDQLDLCGIDERRIFPDLGGVAAELRRYYSASGNDSGEGGSR
jgi:hypothetical protein